MQILFLIFIIDPEIKIHNVFFLSIVTSKSQQTSSYGMNNVDFQEAVKWLNTAEHYSKDFTKNNFYDKYFFFMKTLHENPYTSVIILCRDNTIFKTTRFLDLEVTEH